MSRFDIIDVVVSGSYPHKHNANGAPSQYIVEMTSDHSLARYKCHHVNENGIKAYYANTNVPLPLGKVYLLVEKTVTGHINYWYNEGETEQSLQKQIGIYGTLTPTWVKPAHSATLTIGLFNALRQQSNNMDDVVSHYLEKGR